MTVVLILLELVLVVAIARQALRAHRSARRELAQITAQARTWLEVIEQDSRAQQWKQFKHWFCADRRHRIAFLRAHDKRTQRTPAD